MRTSVKGREGGLVMGVGDVDGVTPRNPRCSSLREQYPACLNPNQLERRLILCVHFNSLLCMPANSTVAMFPLRWYSVCNMLNCVLSMFTQHLTK